MTEKKSTSLLSLRKKIQHFSFFISDKIGNGYSSCVYNGRNDITNQSVAIKVIDMNKLKSINRKLLTSEISILRTITNFPNLLNIHEIYTTKNNTYIISELCTTDLQNLIRKNTKFQESQACQYMKQLQDAYRVIHQLGIIHRDIKPANILVTQSGTLKVADFGFAIQIQELVNPSPYNVGSPLYMAPESLKNSQYSYKTDIWSLGVVFYQMLTGQTPWRSKNQKQLEWKVNSQSIQSKLIGKNFNPSTKQFLLRTLKQNKDERISPRQFINYHFEQPSKPNLIHGSNFYSTSLKNLNRNKCLPTSLQKNQYLKLSSVNSEKSKLNPEINQIKTQGQKIIQENVMPSNHGENMLNQIYQRNARAKTSNFISANKNITSVKSTSKILISQIHFCRFLYKMLNKLSSAQYHILFSNLNNQIGTIQKTYVGIIKQKIMNVAYFEINNFTNLDNHQEYISTTTFKSIEKIAHSYLRKYEIDLSHYWNQNNDGLTYQISSTLNLIHGIYNKLEIEIPNEKFFNEQLYKNEIVIMDYLMTCKQLIQLADSQDYQKFSKKSRIEDIVQGKITSIDYHLFLRIIQKAQKMLNLQITVIEGISSHEINIHDS